MLKNETILVLKVNSFTKKKNKIKPINALIELDLSPVKIIEKKINDTKIKKDKFW